MYSKLAVTLTGSQTWPFFDLSLTRQNFSPTLSRTRKPTHSLAVLHSRMVNTQSTLINSLYQITLLCCVDWSQCVHEHYTVHMYTVPGYMYGSIFSWFGPKGPVHGLKLSACCSRLLSAAACDQERSWYITISSTLYDLQQYNCECCYKIDCL